MALRLSTNRSLKQTAALCHLIRSASPPTFPSKGKAIPHPVGFAVHTSLLLEEKVPNTVRRMRWRSDFKPQVYKADRRSLPPHPDGSAVHTSLLLE